MVAPVSPSFKKKPLAENIVNVFFLSAAFLFPLLRGLATVIAGQGRTWAKKRKPPQDARVKSFYFSFSFRRGRYFFFVD